LSFQEIVISAAQGWRKKGEKSWPALPALAESESFVEIKSNIPIWNIFFKLKYAY